MRTSCVAYAPLAIRIAVLTFLSLLAPPPLAAQDASEKQRALRLISDFTGNVCPRPGGGTQTTAGVKADVSAELKGLTRALMGFKGTVGTEAKKVTWDGPAQADIARALESADKCAMEITKLLIPRFFPEYREPSPTTAPPPSSTSVPAGPRAAASTTQYAWRGRTGILVWGYGRHATVGECLKVRSRLTYIGRGETTRAADSECFRLPVRPVCSFESFGRGPAYPACYETAALCESAYRRFDAASITPENKRQIRRSGCEEIEWGQAAGLYELWASPKVHPDGLPPPLWTHSLAP